MKISRTVFLIAGIMAIAILISACLENVYFVEDEELNQDLMGVWYRYYIQTDTLRQGLSSLTMFKEDGSGTSVSIDDTGQVELCRINFLWITSENTITISTEDDSTLWEGFFSLYENNGALLFSYSKNSHSYNEAFVKYTGGKNPELIGNWIMVKFDHGGERHLSQKRLVFSDDKTGTNYIVPNLEASDSVETKIYYWNTNGNYLITIPEGQQTATVAKNSLKNYRLTSLSYDETGVKDSVIYVKDLGNNDAVSLGSWLLRSWKIDGTSYPMGAQERTLILNDDGRGLWKTVNFQGTSTEDFDWTTNRGYLFIYRDSNPDIAWVQTYLVADSTMVLKTETEYIQGYGWASVEYNLKKTE